MIPLFWPALFHDEWNEELGRIFNTRWLGQGPKVEEFEKAFGEFFGYEYCVAVNSGTAALDLAYELAGISSTVLPKRVISPVLTCTATNIPLLRRRAHIDFADISYPDLIIDTASVKSLIRQDTQAIVAVELGGIPVYSKLFELGKRYNIPVIVDACQSLGIPRKSDGNYVCYSFQAIKHFTTGDGGMLVVRNAEDYQKAKKLRWFGIDREKKARTGWRAYSQHQMTFDIEYPGYKYHMNDIAATMGLVGLRHSNRLLVYRSNLINAYLNELPDEVEPFYGGSCWLFGIHVENRDIVTEKLRASGVECDMVHLRNDIFNVFGGERKQLDGMNQAESSYLYLPLNPHITQEDVSEVCKALKRAL